jgi:hypothetical protein
MQTLLGCRHKKVPKHQQGQAEWRTGVAAMHMKGLDIPADLLTMPFAIVVIGVDALQLKSELQEDEMDGLLAFDIANPN